MTRVLVIDRWRGFAEAVASALAATGRFDRVEALGGVDELAGDIRVAADVVLAGPECATDVLIGPRSARSSAGVPRVIVVADDSDLDQLAPLVRAGAVGWIGRDRSCAELVAVIDEVRAGHTAIPTALVARLVSDLCAGAQPESRRRHLLARLTERETQVLRLMERGLARKEIATELHMSPNTVRTHIQNILQRLEVHSMVAAIALIRPERPLVAGPSSRRVVSSVS
jgi:DNA-binding NarL/FixJ family response regulator